MLVHPTLDKIEQLRLFGMAKALREQLQNQKAAALNFEERLGLLGVADRRHDDSAAARDAKRLGEQRAVHKIDDENQIE